MKTNLPFLLLSLLFCLAFISYKTTFSFFSDASVSASNTFAAASAFPTPIPSPTPTGIANHIVISEVQIDGGPGNADYDFIELYNPTNNSVNLKGYRLVERTGNSSSDNTIKSWSSDTFIQSHGYYLWANSKNADFSIISMADTSTQFSLSSSMSIGLRNGLEDSGTLIDGIGWNNGNTSFVEGTSYPSAPDANQSLERKALSTSTAVTMASGGVDEHKGNGNDVNNNANDFVLRSSPEPQNLSSASESP